MGFHLSGLLGEPLGRTRCTVPVSEMADGLCSPGKEMAWLWKPQKQASSPQKRATSYTKVLGFFRPKKRNPSKKTKNIWISKKRRLGCFFQPPPFKKWSIMIHLSKKSQKRILPKSQVKISSSARFGVLVLCSWPQILFGEIFGSMAAECYQPPATPAEAKQFTLLLVKTVCYAFGFIGFRSFSPKFCTKKMVESERCFDIFWCSLMKKKTTKLQRWDWEIHLQKNYIWVWETFSIWWNHLSENSKVASSLERCWRWIWDC